MPADCTEYLVNLAVDPGMDWERDRVVVFLDPYGMQVTWDTITALGKTEAIEVILNFPEAMAIQRLLYKEGSRFDAAEREKLDQYFGSREWFDLMYLPAQRSLLDDHEMGLNKVSAAGPKLMQWYRKRLKDAFGYATEGALIVNTKGNPLYYLMHAGPHPIGSKIASDVFFNKPKKPRTTP